MTGAIRRTSLRHGTGGRTPRARGFGRSATSCGCVALCARGASRKHHAHTTAHIRLTRPMATKEPRQVTKAIRVTTKGGVMALPMRALAWVMPCAKPAFSPGSQDAIARVATGKVAPSPRPSSTRAAINVAKLPTMPVKIAAAADQSPPCTEAITEPAAGHLEHEIGVAEGGEGQAQLGVRQSEFRLKGGGGARDVHPVDISDEVHCTQQNEHVAAGAAS